ncbi:MAG: hypothetical protein OHK0024_12690 [Thalassobaculales bacterium]
MAGALDWLTRLGGGGPAGGGAEFARFLDASPLGIALADPEGWVRRANAAFQALAGGDVTGRLLADLIHPDDRPAVAGRLAAMAAGDASDLAPEARLADNPERVVAIYLGRQSDGWFSIQLVDVTQRRRLEAQFSQGQKMQAVGQLAGGVAHDFNNLLTAMIGFCDLLLQRHRAGDESFADVMQIKQNASRAANLVRQLLAFSRRQQLAPRVIDVTEVLQELSHLLRRVIGENIHLELEHGRDLKPVRVDPGQLDQVIINLAVNARDAMPEGGRLSLHTANVVRQTAERRGDEIVPAGQYVRIELADTGSGIPPDVLPRIFEPFFTTKPVGKGTGLGLSTVFGIVKQTGGFIAVDSTPGRGTRFTIDLPIHQGDGERLVEAAAGEARARDLTGAGTVLLVEDEDAVRLFAARALRNKGYRVIEARNGEAAIDILADDGEPLDLMITDVVMPGIDGPSLIRQARERRPQLAVICISGYSEDSLADRLAGQEGVRFLPKPFSLRQLAGVVKDAIEGGRTDRNI